MAASAYHVLLKEVKSHILIHNWIFRHTCCINNPHWQISGITIFLCEHYIVTSYTLAGSFLDVLFLLLAVILSGLHEKPRRNKDWVTEKGTQKNLWEGITFLTVDSSFCVTFCCFLHLLPPLSKWSTCWMVPIKTPNFVMCGILCNEIMSKRSKIWTSLVI